MQSKKTVDQQHVNRPLFTLLVCMRQTVSFHVNLARLQSEGQHVIHTMDYGKRQNKNKNKFANKKINKNKYKKLEGNMLTFDN